MWWKDEQERHPSTNSTLVLQLYLLPAAPLRLPRLPAPGQVGGGEYVLGRGCNKLSFCLRPHPHLTSVQLVTEATGKGRQYPLPPWERDEMRWMGGVGGQDAGGGGVLTVTLTTGAPDDVFQETCSAVPPALSLAPRHPGFSSGQIRGGGGGCRKRRWSKKRKGGREDRAEKKRSRRRRRVPWLRSGPTQTAALG